MQECTLIIDTGTSSMRGLLISHTGTLLFRYQLSYFMKVTNGGSAEQDSSCYQDCLIRICRTVSDYCLENGCLIAALSLTSQRSSVLALDRSGAPLYPVLMWYDKRSAAICNNMTDEECSEVYGICGLRPTPVLSAPKMLWMKLYLPEVYHAAHKLAGIHDYLLYLCTGRLLTDASLAGRTCLLDLTTGTWSEHLLKFWGIDADKLCPVILPGETAGHVTKAFSNSTGIPSGTPVISAGGDQQCSLLGQSVLRSGDIGITSGTASYVVMQTDKPVYDAGMRLNLGISALPGKYVLEANNMSSGSVYRWINRVFYGDTASYDLQNEEALSSPPGARGLIMLPDLAGKGCPQWDSLAKGSFYNIGFHHTRPDFCRASLEGICAEIAECFQILIQYGPSVRSVTSAGGLSRFPLFNQMTASMTGYPITVCSTTETTAAGAWVSAMSALKIHAGPEEALASACRNPEEITQKDPEHPLSAVCCPDPNLSYIYRQQCKIRDFLRSSVDNRELAELFSRL